MKKTTVKIEKSFLALIRKNAERTAEKASPRGAYEPKVPERLRKTRA